MTFAEKLFRLCEDLNRSSVAGRAGMPPQYITNYITRGSEPAAGIALRLARALNVDLEWLVDDAAEWPPVRRDAPLPAMTDALRAEVVRLVRDELLSALLRERVDARPTAPRTDPTTPPPRDDAGG